MRLRSSNQGRPVSAEATVWTMIAIIGTFDVAWLIWAIRKDRRDR